MNSQVFKNSINSAKNKGKPLCFFHRSITGLKGSNGLQKIGSILNNKNVDGVEFDLQATSDGQIVIRHDFAIETSSGYRWIKEMSLKELRKNLDENDCPTFDAFIKKVGKTDKLLDIEFKDTGIAKKIIKKYQSSKIYGQFVFTTLYEDIYKEIRESDPNIAVMFGYPRDKGKNLTNRWWVQPIVKPAVQIIKLRLPSYVGKLMEKVPTDFFSFYHKVITKELVEKVHQKDKSIIGATICLNNDTGKKESLEHMTHMLDAGTDLIKTDYPDLYPLSLKNAHTH